MVAVVFGVRRQITACHKKKNKKKQCATAVCCALHTHDTQRRMITDELYIGCGLACDMVLDIVVIVVVDNEW